MIENERDILAQLIKIRITFFNRHETVKKSQTYITSGTSVSLNSLSRRFIMELLWWTTSKKLISGGVRTSPPGMTCSPSSRKRDVQDKA